MSGVVYSGAGDLTLGKFGTPIALASGAQIPPGYYWSEVAWSANIAGTATPMPVGYCESDGLATVTAAGNVVPLGAGMQHIWPWPNPWPIGVS